MNSRPLRRFFEKARNVAYEPENAPYRSHTEPRMLCMHCIWVGETHCWGRLWVSNAKSVASCPESALMIATGWWNLAQTCPRPHEFLFKETCSCQGPVSIDSNSLQATRSDATPGERMIERLTSVSCSQPASQLEQASKRAS